jgi:hypothetical protein
MTEASPEQADPWLSILVDSYRGEASDPPLDVLFRSDTEQVRLRLDSGRLESVTTEGGDPDLVIGLGPLSIREVLLGRAQAGDLISQAAIEVDGGVRRVAPATEEQLPTRGGFEPIRGATLSVGIHVTSAIFGQGGIHESWEDGVLTHSEVLPLSRLEQTPTQVRMSCPIEKLAALRRGELTPRDALADGVVLSGEWPQLMCFTELMQHPAYRDVWEQTPSLQAEAAWGAVFCSPAYGDAALRALIEPIGAPGARE